MKILQYHFNMSGCEAWPFICHSAWLIIFIWIKEMHPGEWWHIFSPCLSLAIGVIQQQRGQIFAICWSPPLAWTVFISWAWTKLTFFDPLPPHLLHVVIEWPHMVKVANTYEYQMNILIPNEYRKLCNRLHVYCF